VFEERSLRSGRQQLGNPVMMKKALLSRERIDGFGYAVAETSENRRFKAED
jgi:hypothetical protein